MPSRWVTEAVVAVVAAAHETFLALGSARAARRLNEFADLVSAAREPGQVEAALVLLAGEVSGARRVELMLDRDERTNPEPRLVALWPEAAASMTPGEVVALGYPLCVGLWCGDHYQMTLQLYARPGKSGLWTPRVIRRLTTLCAVAAAAERGMHSSQRARLSTQAEPVAVVRDATFLNAILPYALNQAQRHGEPLTVFCAEVDGVADLVREYGSAAAELAGGRIADAIARTLRDSDVVARLDDDRIFVVLPNTGGADALTVAQVVRQAMTNAGLPKGGLPVLTTSLGVASFPADAHEMLALLSAADEAMTRARTRGPGQVATAGVVVLPVPKTESDSEPRPSLVPIAASAG